MDIRKLFLQNNGEYAPAVMWFTTGNINKKEIYITKKENIIKIGF